MAKSKIVCAQDGCGETIRLAKIDGAWRWVHAVTRKRVCAGDLGALAHPEWENEEL
jgi:hypothetical protein